MKTGRPKKKEDQFKSIVKHIRYSPDEWEKVQKKLDETGLSFSEFIRRASFSVEINSINLEVVKTFREVQNNLIKIGNNINTIARNSATVVTAEEYDRHLSDLLTCKEIAKELAAEIRQLKDTMK